MSDNGCNHAKGASSTLLTVCLEKSNPPMWLVTCKVCGRWTVPCLTCSEAQERAINGWWIGYVSETRTVEDVLREFAEQFTSDLIDWDVKADAETVARYADELRGMMG